MAVMRKPMICPKCGQAYKSLYKPDRGKETGNYFIGDNHDGYDIAGHKCHKDASFVYPKTDPASGLNNE